MRGVPLFNFPAFFSTALYLRNLGHEVINPAERDMAAGMNPAETNTSDEFDLGQAFAFDFGAIISARAIALLPGWETSKGCAAELVVAQHVGARIYEVDPSAPNGLRPLDLAPAEIRFPDPSISEAIDHFDTPN